MALEKQCDIALKKMAETGHEYHVNAIYHAISKSGYAITGAEIVAIVTILSSNGHAKIIEDIRVRDGEDGKEIYLGTIRITQSGFAFITNGSYENEKERSDLLLNITISNGKIQSSLLSINRWIAFASIIAAIYYSLEMVRNYYSEYFSFLIYYALPFATAIFLLLLLYLLLKLIQKKLNTHKKP